MTKKKAVKKRSRRRSHVEFLKKYESLHLEALKEHKSINKKIDHVLKLICRICGLMLLDWSIDGENGLLSAEDIMSGNGPLCIEVMPHNKNVNYPEIIDLYTVGYGFFPLRFLDMSDEEIGIEINHEIQKINGN